ncbi:Vacuolar protein sorting-associated protein 36-like protein [Drosera capensis]
MSGEWLPAGQLTPSGRPVLSDGEVECFLLSAVDVEAEAEEEQQSSSSSWSLSPYRSGVLVLTNHRLIWISESQNNAAAAAVYIHLSQITHIFSPPNKNKSSLLRSIMFASPRVRFQLSSSTSKSTSSGNVVVTLVMRGKSDNHELFVTRFWEAWKARAWDHQGKGEVSFFGSSVHVGPQDAMRMPVVGVAGILRREQEMWESTDKTLHDAFHDLNALMGKAKEMVVLAETMRQKLLSTSNNHSTAQDDDQMGSKEEMQDWLLSVGIISPVTKESAGALYHQQLSRQLADFVKVPLERAGGMINLIDIYCLFNRACGTALISPDDLLQACSLWEKFDVPVMHRKFDSGVMVIQSKAHCDDEVFAKIKAFVIRPDTLRTGITASDAAMMLGIAPGMAKEHLLHAESKGLLCRDLSPEGFRFFANIFQEIEPENLYLVRDNGVYPTWIASA